MTNRIMLTIDFIGPYRVSEFEAKWFVGKVREVMAGVGPGGTITQATLEHLTLDDRPVNIKGV